MINKILTIILIILIVFIVYQICNLKHLDNKTIQLIKQYDEQKDNLEKEVHQLEDKSNYLKNCLIALEGDQQEEYNKLIQIQREVANSYEEQKKIIRQGFESYCEALDNEYTKKDAIHDESLQMLANRFESIKEGYELAMQTELDKLEKVKATRRAAIQAQLREEEIKNKLSFYCLQLTPREINDIDILEKTKLQLTNPRILSMLIWSTYFQKNMTALCNRILGTNTVTGIYKITNQENGKCYIGQSVDISKRWKDHAKCGLGIDAPQGNQLYSDMHTYGIWRFSWELLEACPREQLNQKEKYYIELYQSNDYGYNSTKGNK